MGESSSRTEFKVVLEGLDISPEHAVRVNQAVQRAAMHALADLGIEGDIRVFLPGLGRRPPFPWGIWIGPFLDDAGKLPIPEGFNQ